LRPGVICITVNTKIYSETPMPTTVRIPHRLEEALAQYCVETRRSKSEVIIELLEQRFAAEPAAESSYDLAVKAGFIGSFASEPDAVGSTKERVKTAIRRKHRRGSDETLGDAG